MSDITRSAPPDDSEEITSVMRGKCRLAGALCRESVWIGEDAGFALLTEFVMVPDKRLTDAEG